MKKYRVIQWATGDVGKNVVAGIVGRTDMELVGAWVHSGEKEGRDVGELCGLKPLGIRATRDKDALLAMPADCVCYTAGRSWIEGGAETVAELCRILRAGKNVVNSTLPPLVYAPAVGNGIYEQLQEACLAGGSSFYTGGIDPGFGSLGLALAALTVSGEVRSIHMHEIMNNATWDSPLNITFFGFGQPKVGSLAIPGVTTSIWKSTLTLVAEAMGVQLDEIVEDYQLIYADEPFDIISTHIAAGTISGARFQIKGMINGEARVVVDHITKLREQDFPEVPFTGCGYRVVIDGEPCVQLDLALSSHKRDSAHAALTATAMTLVNAIPQVCDAAPGVLSYLDLRPHPSKNLLRAL